MKSLTSNIQNIMDISASFQVREIFESIGILGCSIKITHDMIPYFLVLKKKRYTVDLTNNGPNLIQNLFCISADGLPMNGNKMVFICLSIRLFYLFVVFFLKHFWRISLLFVGPLIPLFWTSVLTSSDNTRWRVNIDIVKNSGRYLKLANNLGSTLQQNFSPF